MEIQSTKLLLVLEKALMERKEKIVSFNKGLQEMAIEHPPDNEIFNQISKLHLNELESIEELMGGINHEINKSNQTN